MARSKTTAYNSQGKEVRVSIPQRAVEPTQSEIDALLTLIASKETRGSVETLETRKMDSLDFHDISVWELKAMMRAAYEAGRNSVG